MIAPFFANPEFRARAHARNTLGRVGQVEHLVGAIVFLASDSSALMALTLDDGCTAI